LLIVTIAIATYLYGLLLKHIGDVMPFVDAFTTVSSVVAMVISIRMYAEQWWIWVAVDVFSIYMWWSDFRNGSDNIATLLMWGVYLGNAIIMLIKWEKEARQKNAI
jgi:nicotinamide mononucleotide transporter